MSEFWRKFDEVKPKLIRRDRSFTKIFEYLELLKRPVTIVETGCVRNPGSWDGDGQSTVMFDWFVNDRGGQVYTVDLDPKATAACRELVSGKTSVHTGDSVKYLQQLAASGIVPDLLYLDSMDWMAKEPFVTALHCAREFEAMYHVIRPDTLVVCDDTPSVLVASVVPKMEMAGKGMFVARHAEFVGAETIVAEWQTGWVKMCGPKAPRLDDDVDDLIARGRKYTESNRLADAERAYRAVIMLTRPPKTGRQRVARGEACAFYGRVAASIGAYGTASDWFRDALIADPRCVDYRIELIMKACRPMTNWQFARHEAIRATKIEPENASAWRTLGDIEWTLCDAKRAKAAYDEQLRLAPDSADAKLDRCMVALDMSDFSLAEKLAKEVLPTNRRGDGLHILAMVANRQSRHEDAIGLFDQAIAAECYNQPTAHWNKSLSLHAIGRYREAWVEHEHRKEQIDNPALSAPFLRFNSPLWNKEPAPASIHVHAEAGLGDNICCARFLTPLVERGYDVRYEVHDEMMALMQRSFPQVKVVRRAPDYPGAIGIQPFDYHLPIGTMAHLLDVDTETVPWTGPYLKADPGLVAVYDGMLPDGKRIGLCWSSGIRDYGVWIAEYGRRKSMHFDQLITLVTAIPARFVSLQVGPEREQHHGTIIDVLPEQPSWDDTAALIESLDLVITVDTAVAHLAGALGKPTWVMAQRDAASWHLMCWRPGFKWNDRSPWYPSFRIFRQHEFNQPHYWPDVIEDVTAELRNGRVKEAA